MAFINIAEWTPHHVVQWIQGLEDCLLPYAHFFLEHQINGCRLLTLLPEDLEKLNITKIGHQELILDAIEHLRHLHYNFSTETLQTLALRLGCKSRSTYNAMRKEADCGQCSSCSENQKHEEKQKELECIMNDLNLQNSSNSNHGKNQHSTYPSSHATNDRLDRLDPPFIRRACRKISTNTLSGVCDILASVKQFISWIDKDPFEGQDYYIPIRKTILAISIELVSTSQRDHFVESPKDIIKSNCLTFAEICDRIVQELNDSLAIQPAVLEMVPIKKRPDEEFGMNIFSSYSGIHTITEIKIQSPAHRCGRVAEDDEIVQINYQTVIGWQSSKLNEALKEYPNEVLLTIKKRPSHSKIIGKIDTFKIYKIPQRKICLSNSFGSSLFKENPCELGRRLQNIPIKTKIFMKPLQTVDANDKQIIGEIPIIRKNVPELQNAINETGTNDELKPINNVDNEQNDETNDYNDVIDNNKQLIEKVSLEKPMTGPVYQLLSKPKKLRRRATISGSSPTTVCPPIRIEDLVSLDQKQNKRLATSRKSADPRLIGDCQTDLFSLNDRLINLDHSDLERRMEQLTKSLKECDLEIHPDVLQRRKELIARTYSDEVSSLKFKRRLNFEEDSKIDHQKSINSNQSPKSSLRQHAGQVTCTIVDVGAGQEVQRKIDFNDEKIISRILANRPHSPAERFSTDWLLKRSEATGWIDFWQTTDSTKSEQSVMSTENGFNMFYVLDLNLLYLFADEQKSRPEKLIDINRVNYLSEMFYMVHDRWWFEMRDNQYRYFFSSKVEGLLCSFLTRLKGLCRTRPGTLSANPNKESMQSKSASNSIDLKKNKKHLFSSKLLNNNNNNNNTSNNLNNQSTQSLNKTKSTFYLENECNDEQILQLKPVPTTKLRLSKNQSFNDSVGDSLIHSNAKENVAKSRTPSPVKQIVHQSNQSLKSKDANSFSPSKHLRNYDEPTFYTSLPTTTSSGSNPTCIQNKNASHLCTGNSSTMKSATSEEIQSIYTQRHLTSCVYEGKPSAMSSHSPISDHSLSSSSGISSYYSLTGTGQIVQLPVHDLHTFGTTNMSSLNTSGNLNHPNNNDSFVNYVDCTQTAIHPDPISPPQPMEEEHNDSLLSVSSRSPQRKSSFRLFGSPKMLRKFTSSSKMSKDKDKDKDKDKLNDIKETNASKSAQSVQDSKSSKSKLFLNSPRFTRAIFGSKRSSNSSKNQNTMKSEKCSTACQTDESMIINRSGSETSINNLFSVSSLPELMVSTNPTPEHIQNGNTFACSSMFASNIGAGIQSTCLSGKDIPPTPDASRKPTMGISMLSKRRTSSVGTDRSAIETALSNHAKSEQQQQNQSSQQFYRSLSKHN